MAKEFFMKKAVTIATENVETNSGGPFGAIVVKDGKIISEGRNQVTATNDPTAHAEVQAIRAACKELNTFQLTDCEIYTSCEPCPMCIGAIYWARPKAVYYACTKNEAAQIGFDDQFIYDEIELPVEKRGIKMIQFCPDDYDLPFRTWKNSTSKTEY
jgi:guanine deaminase